MISSEQPIRARCLYGIISTDDIIPARYKHRTTDPGQMAPHLFEYVMPGFADTLRSGDALIADATFGIGSSREQAVQALLAAGVVAVVAPSFGRIFFRNAWNLGLLAIEASAPGLQEGYFFRLDLEKGIIESPDWTYRFQPIPRALVEVAAHGGLLATLRQRYGNQKP